VESGKALLSPGRDELSSRDVLSLAEQEGPNATVMHTRPGNCTSTLVNTDVTVVIIWYLCDSVLSSTLENELSEILRSSSSSLQRSSLVQMFIIGQFLN
jgi:hypothetical protein